MLTVPPASVIWELVNPPPENFGTTFTGPTLPSIEGFEALEETEFEFSTELACAVWLPPVGITLSVADVTPVEVVAGALAKADGGSPPKVCASAASIAYGTLTISILGCSSDPGLITCVPNHRGSHEVKISMGIPSRVPDPNITS